MKMHWKRIGVSHLIKRKRVTLNIGKGGWRWAFVVDLRCAAQIPFKGCISPDVGHVVSRQPAAAVSCFRLCLSCGELPHWRTSPSLGSPYEVTGHWQYTGQGILAQAERIHWAVYATELYMGSAKALLELHCRSVSPSTQSYFLPTFPWALLPNKYPAPQSSSQGLMP